MKIAYRKFSIAKLSVRLSANEKNPTCKVGFYMLRFCGNAKFKIDCWLWGMPDYGRAFPAQYYA